MNICSHLISRYATTPFTHPINDLLTSLYRLSEYGRQSHSRSPLSFINWAHKTGVATAEVYLPLESLYATTTLDVRMIPVLYPLLVLDH